MFRSWNRRRFDLVELLLITLFLVVCLWFAGEGALSSFGRQGPEASRERARLSAAYGPGHYSQYYEEWIIRDFFRDKRDGVFVDVGANHFRDGSTTYYLEKHLGWSGVALEPQAAFEADYRRFRPRTRFFAVFVSDVSNHTARLYMSALDSQTASLRQHSPLVPFVTHLDAPTVTLLDLLDRLGISQIDFLSIDVELSEPKVLDGSGIDRFRPTLVCIEAHPEVRQYILDYFAKHFYVVVGRYLLVDTLNLYFTPLGTAR